MQKTVFRIKKKCTKVCGILAYWLLIEICRLSVEYEGVFILFREYFRFYRKLSCDYDLKKQNKKNSSIFFSQNKQQNR